MRYSICPTAGLLAVLALFPAGPVRGDDGLRIVTVDMQALMRDYHRTGETEKELNVERARIQQQNNERLEAIAALDQELVALRRQLDDPAISDRRKQELFKQLQLKTQEGVALERERREFLQRRQTALNERMAMKTRALLAELRGIVREHAIAEDYDYVFDRAGLSTTQVPVLLYAKDAADLTPILLRKLNEAAPAVSETADPATPPR